MELQKAYEMVLNDLVNSGCSLFLGNYDAKNGSPIFMDGIATVMEFIAYKVSEEQGDKFSDLFTDNVIKSEKVLDKWSQISYNKYNKRKRGIYYEQYYYS